ncbi:uncharacterized protein [Henckelia pumila]|uniref:uncharacterized protein n=1 Tax=Henckelia pumila TaxID=405737 RepID=UPI003C6E85F9
MESSKEKRSQNQQWSNRFGCLIKNGILAPMPLATVKPTKAELEAAANKKAPETSKKKGKSSKEESAERRSRQAIVRPQLQSSSNSKAATCDSNEAGNSKQAMVANREL